MRTAEYHQSMACILGRTWLSSSVYIQKVIYLQKWLIVNLLTVFSCSQQRAAQTELTTSRHFDCFKRRLKLQQLLTGVVRWLWASSWVYFLLICESCCCSSVLVEEDVSVYCEYVKSMFSTAYTTRFQVWSWRQVWVLWGIVPLSPGSG